MHAASASQTIGPYWHLLHDPSWADLTRFGAEGERIVLSGTITDGDGLPVGDACVEIWQASPEANERFPGFGRAATDAAGRFRFTTLKPGPVPGRGNAQQAPHIALRIMARGLMQGLVTRAYFENEPLNETDPLLSAIGDPARRATLIARDAGSGTWHLAIRLQGAGETAFLDL